MDHQSSRTYSIFSRLISDEITIMAIRGIIVGLAGGFGAIGFRYLIGFFQSISYGSAGELLDMVSKIPWCFRITIVCSSIAHHKEKRTGSLLETTLSIR